MKIRFSLRGMERYDALLASLQAQNPLAADRMVVAVDHALRRLKQFPLSGSRVREFPQLPLRQIIVGSYRFVTRTKLACRRWQVFSGGGRTGLSWLMGGCALSSCRAMHT